MSLNRSAARRPNVLLNRRPDRNTAYMPQWGSAETSNGVDYAVNLTLGAFVAVPVAGVILIWGLEPTAAAAGLVLALTGIADRSYLAIRRARAS